MRTASRRKRRSFRSRPRPVHKPRGVLQPRVQRVGPEHFGIVSVDCAKARSKWMLTDFYGTVLVGPTELVHGRAHFAIAVAQIREAMARHRLKDLVVAIEQTGQYHQPVKRAFGAAGFECRIVHPLASKPFRQAAHPGIKTDDTDLIGIFCAAANGFGLLEPPLDPPFARLRLWVRHRRGLVEKRSAVCCQLKEHWQAALPGFAALFEDVWTTPAALAVACHFASPEAVDQAGLDGLQQVLQAGGQRAQTRTLERILAWARTAPSADPHSALHQQLALALDEDRRQETRQIQAAEVEIATLLAETPYVLLLAIPGINVVSAGELAGEMGPISHYANARAITGRAGLFPSRYQSDQVDLANGSLVRCANRRLRAALLGIADNLLKCNYYFRGLADHWKAAGKDPRDAHVRVASRFSRLAYLIVASRHIVPHRCLLPRGYILDKLIAFHQDHQTSPEKILADLRSAADQLPAAEHPLEAVPLVMRLAQTRAARRRGPQPIANILPLLLARLGAGEVESSIAGVRDLG
jgi:transposase